jgi:hypothetical protein
MSTDILIVFIVALRDEINAQPKVSKDRLQSYILSLHALTKTEYNIVVLFHSRCPTYDEKLFWRCYKKRYQDKKNIISIPIDAQPEIIASGKGASELYILNQLSMRFNDRKNLRLVKITGRYRFLNFRRLMHRLLHSQSPIGLFKHPRTNRADTSLFVIKFSELNSFTNAQSVLDDNAGQHLEDYATQYALERGIKFLSGWPIIMIRPMKFRYGLRNFCTEAIYSIYEELKLVICSNRL